MDAIISATTMPYRMRSGQTVYTVSMEANYSVSSVDVHIKEFFTKSKRMVSIAHLALVNLRITGALATGSER